MSSYSCFSPSSKRSKQLFLLSSLLKIISEESKLRLLCILRQGKSCVCEITKQAKLSQSLVSHHLRDLKDTGLIIDEKRGLWVDYSLTDKGKHIINLLFQLSKLKEVGK